MIFWVILQYYLRNLQFIFLTNVALPHGFLGTNSKINADLAWFVLVICQQECLLTNWAHWQGASSTMLKQLTTTYAGEPCLYTFAVFLTSLV